MGNNYDLIAPYYDRLSRLVFGQSQRQAQISQLTVLKSCSRILIAGGGTGWILEEINGLGLKDLEIVYLEASAEMILLAVQRESGDLKIQFLQDSAELFKTDIRFDYILTGFLFDHFSNAIAERVFRQFDSMLKEGGYWLYADFEGDMSKQKWWQTLMLGIMYNFFKIVSGVQEKKVPDLTIQFKNEGYQSVQTQYYFRGFILSLIYLKLSKGPRPD